MKRTFLFLYCVVFIGISSSGYGQYTYGGTVKEQRIEEGEFFRRLMERIDIDAGESLDGGDLANQAAAMFGREDLISKSSLTASECSPLSENDIAVVDYIAAKARDTSVVIVNEAHHITSHRAFVEDVLKVLSEEGYSIYAAEAFSNSEMGENPNDVRLYEEKPYVRGESGFSLNDPMYASVVRTAKSLGYDLVPYEIYGDQQPEPDASFEELISQREYYQAKNLISNVIEQYANPKVVIHVGYQHAAEAPDEDGIKMMALHFKEMSGIDPLTIDQTHCSGTEDTRLARPSNGQYDIAVSHPDIEFVEGRPSWRLQNNAQLVEVPDALVPEDKPVLIDAHYSDEPFDAVPVDRVFVRPGEEVSLVLPPGHYKVSGVYLDGVSSDVYELEVR